MDAEQEEYSEEEKDVGVSCNSEECQDIEQKTTVCLCFLLFYSSEKVARLNNGMSFFSAFLLFKKGRLTPSFWFLGNGCRTRGVFRGREKRWRFLQLRGVPGYWTKNNGMSLFSSFQLSRKGSQVNSFLVFRKWMQNKRSIPKKRKTLGSPATPRSARILHKKQRYVFVFYSFTLQKS